MSGDLKALLRELKAGLAALYGPRLRGVYLYGSYARGDCHVESDFDVLVVLDDFAPYGAEVDRTAELAAALSLQYGVSISQVFLRERDVLTRGDGQGWTIQQNIGHLIDLGCLWMQRIDEILAGKEVLVAADMTNRKTNEANHNEREIEDLLAQFRLERAGLVSRLENLDEADWGKSALHPRLEQPMRIVDIAYFAAEHDDYHLACVSELIRNLT